MITTAAPPRRTGRIARVAIAASLAVHVLLLAFVFATYDAVERLLAHVPVPHRVPKDDETVALSTVLHIEKRTRPAPSHRSHAASPAAKAPRQPVSVTARLPVVVPRPHRVRKAAGPPPVARHELAKTSPRATPRPVATPRPTPLATPVRVGTEGKRLALAEHPAATSVQARPATGRRYTAEQLAQIENDLSKSIAKDRSREAPPSNVTHHVRPATSSRRAAIDFSGVEGKLNGFEGLCEPLRSWTTGSYVHFYVTCRTTHDDGTVRQEALPWPLTYPARRIAYDVDGPLLPEGEVPPPERGWRPDPAQRLDPDVILYLRKKGYRI